METLPETQIRDRAAAERQKLPDRYFLPAAVGHIANQLAISHEDEPAMAKIREGVLDVAGRDGPLTPLHSEQVA